MAEVVSWQSDIMAEVVSWQRWYHGRGGIMAEVPSTLLKIMISPSAVAM